jgi:hypothetical protein
LNKERAMLWKILMLPMWVLTKGLGAVFMVVRIVLSLFRFIFGRRLIAAAVLVAGFFMGKKFLDDKKESETKPE